MDWVGSGLVCIGSIRVGLVWLKLTSAGSGRVGLMSVMLNNDCVRWCHGASRLVWNLQAWVLLAWAWMCGFG